MPDGRNTLSEIEREAAAFVRAKTHGNPTSKVYRRLEKAVLSAKILNADQPLQGEMK